ncbi:linoleate diol synthase [Colletotrichum truncatum]|uniref:Linoleate diol synthase n=1 Tax=Colletotrichum truncatum TaxID=5467 RepID=A0ACC3Z2A4_COLTU|nr:linoleate diol synthase [Colletotrichum truncatum]KAF6786540.1 linoleate diol synthase [Colletotrichum truncatum]
MKPRRSHSSGDVEEHEHANGVEHYHGAPPKDVNPVGPSRGDPAYGKYDTKLTGFRKALRESKRPLPVLFGDGSYPADKTRPTGMQNVKPLTIQDFKTIMQIIKNKLQVEKVNDDKTMIMERTIQVVAKLPHKSRLRDMLTNSFIEELWGSLEHPPLLYLDTKELKLKYRQADGSYNNPLMPKLGAACQPYARSVKPRLVTLGAMPDPGLVFDSVMGRRHFIKHPNNVSSILWYWATIIIHDLFWTDRDNPNISKTSAYLDLSPLYGSNQEMQDSVRTKRDGMLKPDSFADKRLNGMPPGVCVLLIMFNRFHNHVAENLAAINEGGRFTRPAAGDVEAEKEFDEELFQTARLVTCGLYINITLVDYVRNIVNLNRTNTTWTLDPRQEAGLNAGTPDGAESGTGNVNSAEFNLCYRWHSCISEKDDKWIQQAYGDKLRSLESKEKLDYMAKQLEKQIEADPGKREFGGYKRNKDGTFNDDDLVACISSAIEDCAGSFGARNVPQSMRSVEIMGIIQARNWNVAGLNEFRKHFGLKPYEKFEDINSDREVSEHLRHLYQHPDNVELYPGLVAEEAKSPMTPGVGIAPTYTISRVVLSDAVCLVRGDRYYTIDYNPRHLTNWGYKEVEYDLNVNHGCVFYKLFLRAFPNHFKGNSVYAHYPMVIPSENQKILHDLGRYEQFDYSKPQRMPKRVNIQSYRGAQHVLNSKDKYRVIWNEGLEYLMAQNGKSSKLPEDDHGHKALIERVDAQLYKGDWSVNIKNFYANMTEQLLREKSYQLGAQTAKQTHVDLVRDVGNLVHVHFASQVFNLPLKTSKNRKGVYSEHEMYQILAALFDCIFFNVDQVKSFPLRQEAKRVATELGKVIERNVKLTTTIGYRGFFSGSVDKRDPLAAYGTNMIKGLSKTGLNAHDITWGHVLPTAGAMVPNQAQVFAQAVDYYLDHPELVKKIHEVALSPSGKDNDALLLGYAMEGIRLSGAYGSYRVATTSETIMDEVIDKNGETVSREVDIDRGDRVFVSFTGSAARDPVHFPSPLEVDPRRPLDKYIHYGLGPHACLGDEASKVAIIEMFRAVFRRKNLRRVPGPQGKLSKVKREGGVYQYLTEDWGKIGPFPASMKVMWDN